MITTHNGRNGILKYFMTIRYNKEKTVSIDNFIGVYEYIIHSK